MQFKFDLHPDRCRVFVCERAVCWNEPRRFDGLTLGSVCKITGCRNLYVGFFKDVKEAGSLQQRLRDAGVGSVAVVDSSLVLHAMQVSPSVVFIQHCASRSFFLAFFLGLSCF